MAFFWTKIDLPVPKELVLTMTLLRHAMVDVKACWFWIAVASIALAAPICFGQADAVGSRLSSSPTAAPYIATMTFDVASVRESKPDMQMGFMVSGGFARESGSLNVTNYAIANMLALAYGVSWHQLQGLPDWTAHALYNVQAKTDEAANEKLATLSREQIKLEQQHMMQAFLAERFNLKMHWETRQGLVYELLVARAVPKMQAGGSHPPSPLELKVFDGEDVPEVYQRGDGRRGYKLIGHNAHPASLAALLGPLTATEVIDKTCLTGTYDFDLQYNQANDEERLADPNLWPPLSVAVEQQLGLKLVRTKGPVKVLVVDHIDQPSPN